MHAARDQAAEASPASNASTKAPKSLGRPSLYLCSKCGLPKKGHVCRVSAVGAAALREDTPPAPRAIETNGLPQAELGALLQPGTEVSLPQVGAKPVKPVKPRGRPPKGKVWNEQYGYVWAIADPD